MVFYDKPKILEKVRDEKESQRHIDVFYKNRGWFVDRSGSCIQFDCELRKNGTYKKIEEKFRSEDFGDLGIEIMQCIDSGEKGWFYHIQADLLVYAICSNNIPNDIYVVEWEKFRSWFIDYLTKNKSPKVFISPEGKGLSLNIAVNWSLLPKELYKKLSCA